MATVDNIVTYPLDKSREPVINDCGGSQQSSRKASKRDKSKSSIVRRLARRSLWLKLSAGYLDYMQYYFSVASIRGYDGDEIEDRLHYCKKCQHTWQRESRGDVERFRGIGCGQRDMCPLCGSYSQVILSREATRSMMLAQEAIEVSGVKLESYGLKIVLTLPKTESARIDGLLFDSKTDDWLKEVSQLYKLASKAIKAWFSDAPFCLSLDYTGESAPTEPHYHINAYVFPAGMKVVNNSVCCEPIQHYFSDGELELMRLNWRDSVNEAYGLELPQSDIQVRYLGKEASLYHWLRYAYRHPLSDLWRGWRGYANGLVSYSYKKAGVFHDLELSESDVAKAFQRVELIPAHFKRIRWYGALSDGNRGKTMLALGLEREDKAADDDGDSKAWQCEGYYSFVRFERDGVVLELRDDEGKGTGQHLKVLDDKVNYAPKGVQIGRRTVWLAPGERFAKNSIA